MASLKTHTDSLNRNGNSRDKTVYFTNYTNSALQSPTHSQSWLRLVSAVYDLL